MILNDLLHLSVKDRSGYAIKYAYLEPLSLTQRVHPTNRVLNGLWRRVDTTLRHRHTAMTHELHYSERVGPRLAQSRPKGVTQGVGYKLGAKLQQLACRAMLFIKPRLREWSIIWPAEDWYYCVINNCRTQKTVIVFALS